MSRRRSYTLGTTPRKVIEAALPDAFPLELGGADAELVRGLVNQGIDSHLEAILLTEPAKVKHGRFGSRLCLSINKLGMLCLLRRLWEAYEAASGDQGDSEDPPALSLRSDILTSIGIEEV